jgi:hypothetical protein
MHCFDSFFVVESLRKNDRIKTGSELYASYLSPLARRMRLRADEPYVVASQLDLVRALAMIRREVETERLSPFLQIEAHGCLEGMETGNGDFIVWEALGSLLQPINQASENNLFVGASMCRGAWMFRALTRCGPFDRAPFWAMVGPTEDISPQQALAGFGEFYRVVLHDQDSERAMQGLAAAFGQAAIVMAESLLLRFWQHLLRETESSDVSLRSVASKLGIEASELFLPSGAMKPEASEIVFDRHRARYLYLDLFPHLETRFPVRFDSLPRIELGFTVSVRPPRARGMDSAPSPEILTACDESISGSGRRTVRI